MADFDTIYEENDDEPPIPAEVVVNLPDPIIIRGAGNVTMYEKILFIHIMFYEVIFLLSCFHFHNSDVDTCTVNKDMMQRKTKNQIKTVTVTQEALSSHIIIYKPLHILYVL